jgi:UDP-N-acetylglucosamine 2-epimerase
VGTKPSAILSESALLLRDDNEYRRRSGLLNPYGDGHAALRIVDACARFVKET